MLSTGTQPPTWMPTSNNPLDVQNGPLARAGNMLVQVYSEFQQYKSNAQQVGGGQADYSQFSPSNKDLYVKNGMVAVDVAVFGDVSAVAQQVAGANIGMQVTGTNAQFQLIEGYVPIDNLVGLANLTGSYNGQQVPIIYGIKPVLKPQINSQGSAPNQAETGLGVTQALQQYPGIDGSGVTVGVLSDSANQYAGGLSDSISTGDLPPLSRVTVLQDGPAGSTDEGRAMMEEIHDIAPGSNLAFTSAFYGQVSFANGIVSLATTAGAQVIVDDVGYADEPVYQVGPIEQAISSVVSRNNVVYFAAAGNSANKGFESPFRSGSGTVAGTPGTYMNFDPNGSALTLPFTYNGASSYPFLYLQYDQPVNGVSSNVDLILLDANGNQINTSTSGLGGLNNNPANGQPIESVDMSTLPAGQYSLAIRVTSGSAPTRIDLYGFGADVDFTKQYGNSGGITYPTTMGHNAGINTIGVGAVDYVNTPGFSTTTPIVNESYSSFGPRYLEYDVNGNRVAGGTMVLQRPQVSGIDDVDTSFFIPGFDSDGDGLPNFTGTSAAAPNLAAVAALMRQFSPGVSQADVLTAMKNSAIPLNGAAAGTWDPQGGYGLVQAPAALSAVDHLRVLSTTPSNGVSLSTPTNTVTVNFNKPVNPTTVQASDLQFTQTPPGVSVIVTVQSVSGSTVVFGLQFVHSSGATANGSYAFALSDGAMASADGKSLAAYSSSFAINDTTAPRITSTSFNNRKVTVQFSEPIDPSTITKNNLFLVRTGSSGVFNSPTNVILNQPGVTVSYDPKTNRATIDLSGLPQSQLPTDTYALFALDNITDLVGNKLDGDFGSRQLPGGQILGQGVFPSGNGLAGGSFIQFLGQVALQAPNIQYVKLDPNSDSGVQGDHTTYNQQPTFVGQVSASFPGAVSGLQVVVQFNGLHDGTFDLTQGANGRGYNPTASVDVFTTTDASGKFQFQVPQSLSNGFYTVRVIVIGAPDQPPLPGLSSLLDTTFRIDTTAVTMQNDPNSVQQNQYVSSLDNGIILDAVDVVFPGDLGNPLAVPITYQNTALDPARATNISNYKLVNIGTDSKYNPANSANYTDESSYIASVTYTDTTNRTQTNSPLTGQVHVSFHPGVPNGRYVLIAMHPQPGVQGISDAAGNTLDGDLSTPGVQDAEFYFNFRSTAAYVTNAQNVSPDGTKTGPRQFFEVSAPGTSQDAPAPPNSFILDFSTTLDPNADYSGKVELVGSANSAGAYPDGDFGTDPTFTNGIGYHVVPGTTVTLENSILGAQPGQPGYKNRLVVSLPAGTALAPDHYRLFLPNMVMPNGNDLRIYDVYGNQIDGEFLGAQASDGTYQDLLPDGSLRSGLSGDDTPGGSFEYGFLVVPNGNVIYAKADYVDDPYLTSDDADGSAAHPFPVLAPQALPNAANGGDLNSSVNFGTGFNPNADLAGTGQFERSAFYAAAVLSQRGPVVVLAEASNPGSSQTFVLQKPNLANASLPSLPDGSASVPNNTTLVFQPGSVLKMYDSSLFVQRQGSAIQFLGGPNPTQKVVVTSYLDDSVAGDTNGDGAPTAEGGTGATPQPGDFGGIVLRNFDDTTYSRPIPVAPGPDDPGRVNLYQNAGLTQKLGLSGADDGLSIFDNMSVRFAGGAVPGTIGYRYDAITLFNSRPAITNVAIDGQMPPGTNPGANGGSQAGISVDMDSLREDPLARGPLVRNTTVFNTSLNGIYVRAELDGAIEATNAVFYTSYQNGVAVQSTPTSVVPLSYSFDDPLPYLLITRMVVGEALLHNSGLRTTDITNSVYVDQGMMLKFNRGAGIDQVTQDSLLNFGDRAYIDGYNTFKRLYPAQSYGPYMTDANGNSVVNPYFSIPTVNDAHVVLTSLYDDLATTQYVDPNTGKATTIVPAINSANSASDVNQPTPTNVPTLARWGSIAVQSGAKIVMDETDVRYGGGTVNENDGTIPQRDVLAFVGAAGGMYFGQRPSFVRGTTAYITNNNFNYNEQAPISETPNGLLAADPLTPLDSGNPFFRGNIMTGNDVNGLEVYGNPPVNTSNLDVDSVWDDTDITYVLRGTVVLGGGLPSGLLSQTPIRPSVVLTLQSALPGTTLADGSQIPKPGESLLVKLYGGAPLGDGTNGQPSGNVGSSYRGGAGFIAGWDNGVDPPNDRLSDPGPFSQLRIVGIGGNETTGQERVPVVITSARDNSVGKTVRGVSMDSAIPSLTGSPQAGDGGVIAFGANTLSDYNLYNPKDGNIIDNADIKYITRIDVQGGGFVYNGADTQTKVGNNQDLVFNTAKAMTISNSDLSYFSQAGVVAHPSYVNALDASVFPVLDANGNIVDYQLSPGVARDTTLRGQGIDLFLVNNVLANMPIGVTLQGDTVDNTHAPAPTDAVFLNNTFYNTDQGIFANAPAWTPNPNNDLSATYFVGMNNIFANNATAGVTVSGQSYNSQLEYNLFSGTPTQTVLTGAQFLSNPFNAQAITGNAAFKDAPNGNFSLLPTSDAIDAALSELKQVIAGNLLRPLSVPTAVLNSGTRLPNGAGGAGSGLTTAGRTDGRGGLFSPSPGDILTQPGYPTNLRGYDDQFVPAVSTNSGSPYFAYTPIDGERDIAGFLRQDDPTKATVGSGSRPFFDIGAYEYRQLFPPEITNVRAVIVSPTTGGPVEKALYQPGGISGTNQSPLSLLVDFNQKIDAATLNSLTVLLQASGGDGIFGNANNSQDRYINLSGKLVYDPNSSVLTINLGSLGLNLSNDLYRVTILGSGGNVVRNPQGLALDGENTVGGSSNGAQLTLPSGDGNPGGDFFVTFSIDTHPPAIVPGTFQLAADSDNYPNDRITSNPLPTFTGTITDIAPPANPVAGQTVAIDISSKGDGNFDIMDAGTGTTDAQGNFSVTLTKPLPNSVVNVGPDGILGTADDVLSSYSWARVRITDQSGNQSSTFDPNVLYRFDEDHQAPSITAVNPAGGSVLNPVNNQVTFSVAVDENIDPKTLIPSNFTVLASGGDGVFGNGNDVQLLVDPSSITEDYLRSPSGAALIHFTVSGVASNDLYQVTINGGSGGLADLAGNLLNGGSKVLTYQVLSPAFSHTIFVDANATGTAPDGSRANPYPTITDGLAAAKVSDTVAVISGTTDANVYTESINLKSFVRVVSADPASTDGNVIPGNPLKTVIRAPYTDGTSSTPTVTAKDVSGLGAFPTEISGFTIASPLTSGGATGTLINWSVGVLVDNSNVLIDRNYLIDNFAGVAVNPSQTQVATPTITDNGIIGNQHGIVIFGNSVSGYTNNQATQIINNTIADNTYGLTVQAGSSGPAAAAVLNNIFWQNASRLSPGVGAGILATSPGKLFVGNNLFSANGPSVNSPADDTINVGGGFNPSLLGPSHDALGNITGDPAFVMPIDPRPEANGPGTFFLAANYDIKSTSAAIDNAINASAPGTDFLYRGRTDVPGRGYAGPADMGAFEYNGTGGIKNSASGTVTSTPALPTRPTSAALGSGVTAASASSSGVTVKFSSPVDRSSVQATDLLISGNGLDVNNPAHATSLTWIDNQTVQFNLSGSFRPNGTVTLNIPSGAVLNSNNTAVPEFTTQTSSPTTPSAPTSTGPSGGGNSGGNTPTGGGNTPTTPSSPVATFNPVTVTPVTPVQPIMIPAGPTPSPTPANTRQARLLAARQAQQAARQARLEAQQARRAQQVQIASARQPAGGFLARLRRFGR